MDENTVLSENTGKIGLFYNIGNIVHRTNFRMFQRKHLAKRRPLRATCVHRNLRFHHAHFLYLACKLLIILTIKEQICAYSI